MASDQHILPTVIFHEPMRSFFERSVFHFSAAANCTRTIFTT
jgi:hypothetical protein